MSEYLEEKDNSKLDERTSKIEHLIEENLKKSYQWISIEFYPPKTKEGLDLLYKTVECLKPYNPLFADVTWGAGGSTSDLTTEICHKITNTYQIISNMHLTCTNMKKELIDKALVACKDYGIFNILALRGDPPAGQQLWTSTEAELCCALDLLKYIKISTNENDFCISVSGYPEGHPNAIVEYDSLESMSMKEFERHSFEIDENGNTKYFTCPDESYVKELNYLKEKVDAGAKFIITQMFFDFNLYKFFVDECRNIGINVPIIPGIMCISSYSGFKRMTKFCKSRVSVEMYNDIEKIKDSEDLVKQYGIDFGVSLCKKLLEYGAPGLHFYTLNTANTTISILEKLGYHKEEKFNSSTLSIL